jgi:hypothetical protein
MGLAPREDAMTSYNAIAFLGFNLGALLLL